METRTVRIVGAGYSGLLAAYYLRRRGFTVEVFEGAPRAGGLLHTIQSPWGPVETGANGFLSNAELESVCDTIGCALSPSRPESRRRFIFRRGRARQWPLRFFETIGFVLRFVLALLFRFLAPRRNESLELWGERVGGRAFTRFLLAPAISGIYASPLAKLSASLVLGRFFNRAPRPPRGRLRGLVSPRRGLGDFVERLEAYLARYGVVFHKDAPVTVGQVESWLGGEEPVFWATSLRDAIPLVTHFEADLGGQLARVESAGLTTMTVFYSPSRQDLRGFGCLFPRSEGVTALGVLFNTEIFPGRGELRSETWIYGAADTPREDALLLDILRQDRYRLTGRKDDPVGTHLTRWDSALPVYGEALEAALADAAWTRLEARGLHFLGNYRGSLGLSRLVFDVKQRTEGLR